MKKKCQVVMLPTENDSNLFIGDLSNSLHYNHSIEKGNSINQHLYIVRNEGAIATGEWCYHKGTKEVILAPEGGFPIRTCFKIIATTDPELHKDGVAKIGLPFIEKYITEYNKGNVIKEVNVEYNEYTFNTKDVVYGINTEDNSDKPKLRSDGTIIIHKIQGLFTKEDMMEAWENGINANALGDITFETWFEQNY